jgi:hypothetical protein
MVILADQTDMPKREPRVFQLLEFTNPTAPFIRTKVLPDGAFREFPILSKGVWRLDLQLRWDGGTQDIIKCFRWSNTALPIFIDCPEGDILRERAQFSNLSSPAELPVRLIPDWMARLQAHPELIPPRGTPPAPEPLSEEECHAVWSDSSTADMLYLAIRNGTPYNWQFTAHIHYIQIWSLVQHRYVDAGYRHGLYGFKVYESPVTPDKYGTRRVIERTNNGFKIRSTDADRTATHSEYGHYKLGLHMETGGRTIKQELCFDLSEEGLSKAICFGDSGTDMSDFYGITPQSLDEDPSTPPSPESTQNEN